MFDLRYNEKEEVIYLDKDKMAALGRYDDDLDEMYE